MKQFSQYIIEASELTLQYHDELNSKFWSGKSLKPVVRKKLLEIGETWAKWANIPENSIVDVVFVGGNANYNYTDHSDIDVHVIVDREKIPDCPELIDDYFQDKKELWSLTHDIKVYGHDVELYAQDINQLHMASGLYSLLKGEWIRKPEYDPPTIDPKDVSRKVEAYGNEIDSLKKRLKSASPEEAQVIMDYAGALKKKLSRARDEKLVYKGGEFSIENLVFKEMRNNGMFGDLINIRSEAYGKIYSE